MCMYHLRLLSQIRMIKKLAHCTAKEQVCQLFLVIWHVNSESKREISMTQVIKARNMYAH